LQKLANEIHKDIQVLHYPPGTSQWIACVLDEATYDKGIEVADKDFKAISLLKDDFHPDWNYSICQNNH
jgi:hypothetical protein